jgi:S-adenosylmethionine/arginine decarboxylase-like enzyme
VKSYHFVGVGRISSEVERGADHPARLAATITELIGESGMQVVAEYTSGFDRGGKTLVWILAESHLVLHVWRDEAFATLDLHVCDYTKTNADKARHLRGTLSSLCFDDQTGSWSELEVPYPAAISSGT